MWLSLRLNDSIYSTSWPAEATLLHVAKVTPIAVASRSLSLPFFLSFSFSNFAHATCKDTNVQLGLLAVRSASALHLLLSLFALPPSPSPPPFCLLRYVNDNVKRDAAASQTSSRCFVFCLSALSAHCILFVVFQARLDVEHVKLERRSPARPAILFYFQ